MGVYIIQGLRAADKYCYINLQLGCLQLSMVTQYISLQFKIFSRLPTKNLRFFKALKKSFQIQSVDDTLDLLISLRANCKSGCLHPQTFSFHYCPVAALSASVSRLSSFTTAASASGLTPFSISPANIVSVRWSSPQFKICDIS